MPTSTRRLLYSSLAWSVCSVLILIITSLSGKLFVLHEALFYSLFILTLAALCGGTFFLARLLKLSLVLFGKRASKQMK